MKLQEFVVETEDDYLKITPKDITGKKLNRIQGGISVFFFIISIVNVIVGNLPQLNYSILTFPVVTSILIQILMVIFIPMSIYKFVIEYFLRNRQFTINNNPSLLVNTLLSMNVVSLLSLLLLPQIFLGIQSNNSVFLDTWGPLIQGFLFMLEFFSLKLLYNLGKSTNVFHIQKDASFVKNFQQVPIPFNHIKKEIHILPNKSGEFHISLKYANLKHFGESGYRFLTEVELENIESQKYYKPNTVYMLHLIKGSIEEDSINPIVGSKSEKSEKHILLQGLNIGSFSTKNELLDFMELLQEYIKIKLIRPSSYNFSLIMKNYGYQSNENTREFDLEKKEPKISKSQILKILLILAIIPIFIDLINFFYFDNSVLFGIISTIELFLLVYVASFIFTFTLVKTINNKLKSLAIAKILSMVILGLIYIPMFIYSYDLDRINNPPQLLGNEGGLTLIMFSAALTVYYLIILIFIFLPDEALPKRLQATAK